MMEASRLSIPRMYVLPFMARVPLVTAHTNQVYSNGLSEIMLGKAIKELKLPRDEIVVMTKVIIVFVFAFALLNGKSQSSTFLRFSPPSAKITVSISCGVERNLTT